MEAIFHEKQEGSLCAQHCLNALLQGELFTAVDLATLAERLDEAEKQHMAEGGENSEEYRHFLQQPSTNMDDSGFFSVQVIASALRVWSLDLIPFRSQDPIAIAAKVNPKNQKAFICNYREHWFTVRKLGDQWFNLNSLLTGPELISDTYLVMFLTQLEQEGYAIFIVNGILPECEADVLLRLIPAVQTVKPRLLSEARKGSTSRPPYTNPELEDEQLQAALKLSLEAESLELASEAPDEAVEEEQAKTANPEEVRNKRLAFFAAKKEGKEDAKEVGDLSSDDVKCKENNNSSNAQCCSPPRSAESNFDVSEKVDMTEEEMLQVAIKMSMSDEGNNSSPNSLS